MHLLAAQAGALQQDGEAIDLNQTPGDIVVASAADSELTLLAGAVDRRGETGLRLAHLLRLQHHMSVDLWIDKTVRHARIVVVRLLGGARYWSYGVEQLATLAASGTFALALLPGDATPDLELRSRSTVAPALWERLHALFTLGGPGAADAILALLRGEPAAMPAALPRFGHWRPLGGLGSAPERTDRPVVPIIFYRAAVDGGGTATVTALADALVAQGLTPAPLMVASLKEPDGVAFVRDALAALQPDAILNLTGFALGLDGGDAAANPFGGCDAPVIQLVQSGRPEALWAKDRQGLTAKDLAMQVVLPELDGRVGALLVGHKADAAWHDPTQCPLATYAPDAAGVAQAAALAAAYARLRHTPRSSRRIALVLANYPIRDGRLANGVGYDAPESTLRILKAMKDAGYTVSPPANAAALMAALQAGPTNAAPHRTGGIAYPLSQYRLHFDTLPAAFRDAVLSRWGDPADDPFVRDRTAFQLPGLTLGHVTVMLQPARGYDRDAEAMYHDPDLVPPHAYVAAYLWLRETFGAHALIHNGKHGSLEWLPGKAVALDAASAPLALWGGLPHLYPFIVNDPGEGTQAKRRAGATIIDHLVPPLTRAETYGPLKDLEALLDEYYAASGLDRRRLGDLRRRILALAHDARLDRDIALPAEDEAALTALDTFLCEIKEAQIRDGLHVFGLSPTGRLRRDLLVALVRVPRGDGPGDASLIRALADDLHLGIDPLTATLGQRWTGPRRIAGLAPETPFHTLGDVVRALEDLAAELVERPEGAPGAASAAVLAQMTEIVAPRLDASGPAEMRALLDGLDGHFIRPGSSGAPTRGRIDVLPTGRNFYSVDTRAVPTPTAWLLGQRSAEALLDRHFEEHGAPLRSLVLSAWGTSCMRTGGDDIAQALALIGVSPRWDAASLRLDGYEIIPLPKLGRPRVDVTLRISGLFRDAFPTLITLFDRAIRAVGALDEPEADNPIAARMRIDALSLMQQGADAEGAGFAAGHRIFGSKPGGYGAGLQHVMDSGQWRDDSDLARAFLNWGQYAYGAHADGLLARERLVARLSDIEAVVHNQDNREHDVLDSDDYYQFEGGLAVTARVLQGERPAIYHNDHSRPDRPVTRTLDEEIARVMRARVVNPKWIAGVMRHGYKGAFEIVATVDYMLAFAATTGAVKTHHFDLAFAAFIEDEEVAAFLQSANRHGRDELLRTFAAARERGYWTPRSNRAHAILNEGTRPA